MVFIRAGLFGALGAMLVHLGATIMEWEYWVVLLIVMGISICEREQ